MLSVCDGRGLVSRAGVPIRRLADGPFTMIFPRNGHTPRIFGDRHYVVSQHSIRNLDMPHAFSGTL